MKKLFFPCTLDGLPRHTGSRMIRCEWVAKHWRGAEVYNGTQRLLEYQLFVFQKAYLSQDSLAKIMHLAQLRDRGDRVALAFDLCDPDFLDPGHARRLLAVLPQFDFAVAPTKPLVDWLAQYVPAYLVPDGVDLESIPVYRGFVDNTPPKIAWMGYQGNAEVLADIAPDMVRLGLSGDVVAVDTPLPFTEFVAKLVEYDILLNPRPDKPPYCYKSDNKSLIAWAAGVAVARDGAELERLLDPGRRQRHLADGLAHVRNAGNILASVRAWKTAVEAEL